MIFVYRSIFALIFVLCGNDTFGQELKPVESLQFDLMHTNSDTAFGRASYETEGKRFVYQFGSKSIRSELTDDFDDDWPNQLCMGFDGNEYWIALFEQEASRASTIIRFDSIKSFEQQLDSSVEGLLYGHESGFEFASKVLILEDIRKLLNLVYQRGTSKQDVITLVEQEKRVKFVHSVNDSPVYVKKSFFDSKKRYASIVGGGFAHPWNYLIELDDDNHIPFSKISVCRAGFYSSGPQRSRNLLPKEFRIIKSGKITLSPFIFVPQCYSSPKTKIITICEQE